MMLGFGLGIWRTGSAGPAWTPSLISPMSWWDPSDLTTLFQDSAGTIPVTADGDPVGYMADKSGNGRHATQVTSSKRPLYKTSGGLHWLLNDGVDDGFNFTSTSPISIYASLTFNKATAALETVCCLVGTMAIRLDSPSLNYRSPPTVNTDDFTYSTGTTKINGSTGVAITQNVAHVLNATAPLPKALNGLLLPASAARTWSGKFFGAVFVSSALSAPNDTLLTKYLGSKAGLSL